MSAIRVVALCVLARGDSILVFEAFDSVKGSPFYRPLGGDVERGETTEQAVVREIREEIDQAITDVRLLGAVENIFTLESSDVHTQNEDGREIDFLWVVAHKDQA